MKTGFESTVAAAAERRTGQINPATLAYLTDGGTYVIATDPSWTDNGMPRDLVAVLPMKLETSRVVPLFPTVNPDLVAALRKELDS